MSASCITYVVSASRSGQVDRVHAGSQPHWLVLHSNPTTKQNGQSRPVSRGLLGLNAYDTPAHSTALRRTVFEWGADAGATAEESLPLTAWAQNRPQHDGAGMLLPSADLFTMAGVIVAKRAARGGASDAELAAIITRAGAQAARLAAGGAER